MREKEEALEEKEKKEQDRKLRKKEMQYQERLKNWENREYKKSRELDREKNKENIKTMDREREARRLKQFLEDYDDERDDHKFYKGHVFQHKLQDRDLEKEMDNRDRAKEKEELEELRSKIMSEGHDDPDGTFKKACAEREESYKPVPIIDTPKPKVVHVEDISESPPDESSNPTNSIPLPADKSQGPAPDSRDNSNVSSPTGGFTKANGGNLNTSSNTGKFNPVGGDSIFPPESSEGVNISTVEGQAGGYSSESDGHHSDGMAEPEPMQEEHSVSRGWYCSLPKALTCRLKS